MDGVDEMLHRRDGHRRVLRGPCHLAGEARRGSRGMSGIGEDVGEVGVAGGGGEAAVGWPRKEVETEWEEV
jgi:hypothetical protein